MKNFLSSFRPSSPLRVVHALHALFLLVAFYGINGPFVSAHYVRQDFTFDVTQHVFHEGFKSIVNPRTSFSQLTDPQGTLGRILDPLPHYTIAHLEFPFHGVFGWPFARLFKDYERAIARLVTVVFALLSIRLCYEILSGFRLPVFSCLAGAGLWATAPLLMQFGQVPMPDILAVAGMAASFLFAMRGGLIASSLAFLFAILAKLSIIVYGLPVITTLLIARNCRSVKEFVLISLKWGFLPAAGIIGWLSMSLNDPPGSWVVVAGFQPGEYGHVHAADFVTPGLCLNVVMYLLPFGCGAIGALAILFFRWDKTEPKIRPVFLAAMASVLSNFILERITWMEPQYSLPIVFWLVIAASFGMERLRDRVGGFKHAKAITIAGICAHVVLAGACVCFLKAPRVSNLAELQAAGGKTPEDARIVVYSTVEICCPAVWMDRNILRLYSFNNPTPAELGALFKQLDAMKKAGFDYFMLFDTDDHYSKSILRGFLKSERFTRMTRPEDPAHKFFDQRLDKLYDKNGVVLYSLKSLNL